jgi:hypothetical protein
MPTTLTEASSLRGRENSLIVRRLKSTRKKQEKLLQELQNIARDKYVQEQINLLKEPEEPIIGYKLSEENLQLVLNSCKIFKKNNLTVDQRTMVNSWVQSIKEYTKDTKYAVPKKGTVEHDAVTEIQKRLKGLKLEIPVVVKEEVVAVATAPKVKKVKKVKAIIEDVEAIQEV